MMYETEAGSGEYQVASDSAWPKSGYTFNEDLSKCENGSILIWDEESKKVLMKANTSDKCYVYFDKEPNTLASYIINNVYTGIDGENDLYYHDGSGSYTNADQEAGDNSYRYSGANPNNYVCFGSDETICPDENLYRIIGVFGENIKLIKASSYGNYRWSNNTDNTWNNSVLNTDTLNTTYYNNLESKWQNMITIFNWKTAELANSSMTVKTIYTNEVINNSISYATKIGLIYVSDYGYAASPEAWTINLNLYNSSTATNNNWMFIGLYEWTITAGPQVYTGSPRNPYTDTAFFIQSTGEVYNDYQSWLSNEFSVRPSFYLGADVIYISGIGTQSNPYRISA